MKNLQYIFPIDISTTKVYANTNILASMKMFPSILDYLQDSPKQTQAAKLSPFPTNVSNQSLF